MTDIEKELKKVQRVLPKATLFAQITEKIEANQAEMMPFRYWQLAAAAIFLILLNSYFLLQGNISSGEVANEGQNPYQIVTNFNLYAHE